MRNLKRSAALIAVCASTTLTVFASAYAQSTDPIKIGVIAEAQAVAGSSIPQAAQLAADEINAAGGVNERQMEIISYDDRLPQKRYARSSAPQLRTTSARSSLAT